MKRISKPALTFFISLSIAPFLLSWGIFGHEHINHAAVLCLPSPVQEFFYNHIDFITQESTVPDLRKYSLNDRSEFPRHYINLERFGARDSLPKTLEEAKKKYGEELLAKSGMLPWYIDQVMDKLSKAFKEKRKTEILFLAADLGHYIGDAHMPLHTSENHDGQLTDQRGIHAFWESHLPDLFGKEYNFNCPKAEYINDVPAKTWQTVFSSFAVADSMLLIERELKANTPVNEIHETDASGKPLKSKFNQPVHTSAYAEKYHKALKGMVERQMRRAITMTASYWYTAWINAGKPDLSDLDPKEMNEKNKKSLQEELKLMEKGKMIDLGSEKEF